jgi:hypothetical protein
VDLVAEDPAVTGENSSLFVLFQADGVHEGRSLGRRRRPHHDPHEKLLPVQAPPVAWWHTGGEASGEAERQAKEESCRSTLSAPHWGHRGEASLDLRTRVSKQRLQQAHRYS